MRVALRVVVMVLSVVALYLVILLYRSIAEPVRIERIKKQRYTTVIERLEKIKELQLIYRAVHDSFAPTFSELISALQKDTIAILKVIGNPDDTTTPLEIDTLRVLALDSVLRVLSGTPLDSVRFIPFSRGVEFEMHTGWLTTGMVRVPVLEVKAPDTTFLWDLPAEYVDRAHALILGSLTEATLSGNW